ncbi:MAG: hypothetical protein Q7R56_01305, partial [Nanoarchaeota archaeon]|nr:hypothetical protein [Nanoarchaeota archaeon]
MLQEELSIRVKDLETLLEFLPEPTSIHVHVYGIKNVDVLARQMGEIVRGVYTGTDTFTDITVKEPTKEKILAIARHQEKRKDLTQLHPVNQDTPNTGMQLQRAIWHMGTNGIFMTDSYSLFAQYQGESAGLLPTAEPKYLRDMRQALPFLPYTIYVNQ